MKQWYEKLFESYAERYDQETFTQGTKGECDFIEEELGYDKSLKIIDIGCGTGRHAIELARRGYSVTGVDLSEAQLNRARKKAAKENLQVEFVRHDARHLPFESQYDVAIMLCDGAFPLMETDQKNFDILRSVTKALKAPGQTHSHFPLRPVSSIPHVRPRSGGRQRREEPFRLHHHEGASRAALHR